MNRRTFFFSCAFSALAVAAPSAVSAEETLLTVTTTGQAKELTEATLMALPQLNFETATNWTEGVLAFSGPSLKSVLDAAGVTDGDVKLTAINDYSVSIPWDVIKDDAPIVANRINGEPFSRREKGPLWVVFPYDSNEEYRTERMYSYSIWQLDRITVD